MPTAAWTPSSGARRVADFVDHTLLKAEATKAEIEKLCAEAKQYKFAAVCVNGTWVELCVRLLQGTGVAVASVVGFPLGAMTMRAKAAEAREAVASGAGEIDMVVQLGRLKSGLWTCVEDDIRGVVEAARPGIVKVILETAALTREEIVKASAIREGRRAPISSRRAPAFNPSGGASLEAVRLMRLVVGDALGVKASGGIRDCETALAMIAAGANRLGTLERRGLRHLPRSGPAAAGRTPEAAARARGDVLERIVRRWFSVLGCFLPGLGLRHLGGLDLVSTSRSFASRSDFFVRAPDFQLEIRAGQARRHFDRQLRCPQPHMHRFDRRDVAAVETIATRSRAASRRTRSRSIFSSAANSACFLVGGLLRW